MRALHYQMATMPFPTAGFKLTNACTGEATYRQSLEFLVQHALGFELPSLHTTVSRRQQAFYMGERTSSP